MKKVVWENKSNKQLCITIPKNSGIKVGDVVEMSKKKIESVSYVVFVGDLFHYGHLKSLEFSKSQSDLNICGLLTDKAVEEYRIKPICKLNERKKVVSSIKYVDEIMIQNKRDPTENLRQIHSRFPNAKIKLIHGSDLRYIHGKDFIEEINGEIIKHPYYKRLSNFKIIEYFKKNKNDFKDILQINEIIEKNIVPDSEFKKQNKQIILTKTNTLKTLKKILKLSKIEDIYDFTVGDWDDDRKEIIRNIHGKFHNKIIVRSSAINEDSLDESMAGCFESFLDIDSQNKKELISSIKKTIDSYKNKKDSNPKNQILIQNQTENVLVSGVVLTRDIVTGAPYYIINYDDITGKTDTVTRGLENKTIKILKNSKNIPEKFQKLIASIKEIEEVIPYLGLDIEFAITGKDIVIFQARPIATKNVNNIDDSSIFDKVEEIRKQVDSLLNEQNHLFGKRTILADMPDWNPAEIIGNSAQPLDYSLYDYIITNKIWHNARTIQGYKDVNPAPLVLMIGNKPYVNVRSSFNSFLPSSLSNELSEKIINFYIEKLERNPELQDKVEFEILHTCYDFSFDDRSKELPISEGDLKIFKNSLISLTNNLINNSKKDIYKDLESLKVLEEKRKNILNNLDHDSFSTSFKTAKDLLDACKEHGTLQFSKLARLGFIGKTLLKSMVKKNIISQEFYYSFFRSISTVASEMSYDLYRLKGDPKSRRLFIEKYYHLRPGTYDITSMTYKNNPNLISFEGDFQKKESLEFILDKETKDKINNELKKHGLHFLAEDLLDFVKSATEAREFSKFEFTKTLSDAIEIIAMCGEEMEISRKCISNLDINFLFSLIYKNNEEIREKITKEIKASKEKNKVNESVLLPPIIYKSLHLNLVSEYTPKPNYITTKRIHGITSKIGNNENVDISGKIILIENGDPGYDWIFTKNIAGIITRYGGVASHMSIRCAEFGIPAAIGAGALYDKIKEGQNIVLDCKSRKIITLNE